MRMLKADELVARAKARMPELKMVISHTGRDFETEWKNEEGRQVALCLGAIAACPNSPVRFPLPGIAHLCIHWGLILDQDECPDCDDSNPEFKACDIVESWLRNQPLLATEYVFTNSEHRTRATWHAGKNRWMFGPKELRYPNQIRR